MHRPSSHFFIKLYALTNEYIQVGEIPTIAYIKLKQKGIHTMLRAIAIALLLALSTQVGFAKDSKCLTCDEAERARGREVKGSGSPDSSLVCFPVEMTDDEDSVAITISYPAGSGKGDWTQTLPRGSALKFGKPGEPAICLPRDKVRGAVLIRAIPGSKETCLDLKPKGIALLLADKLAVAGCLKKECNPPKK